MSSHKAARARGYIRDYIGIIAVLLVISPHHQGFWAELASELHRHTRVYSIAARFVATGCHHTSVTRTTDQHRLAYQLRLIFPLYRDEKGV